MRSNEASRSRPNGAGPIAAPSTDRPKTTRPSTSWVGPTRSMSTSCSQPDAPGASACCASPARTRPGPKIGLPAHCHRASLTAPLAGARPLPHRAARLDRRALRDRAAPPEVDLALRMELPEMHAQEPGVRLPRPLGQVLVARSEEQSLGQVHSRPVPGVRPEDWSGFADGAQELGD